MDSLDNLDTANCMWMLLDREYSKFGMTAPTYRGVGAKQYYSSVTRDLSRLTSRYKKYMEAISNVARAIAVLAIYTHIRLIMLSAAD